MTRNSVRVRRQNFLLLVFLGLSVCAMAQQMGKVVDKASGAPADFVNVALSYRNGNVKFSITDSGGRFAFDTALLVRITLSKTGYETKKVERNEAAFSSFIFLMETANHVLTGVTVTAVKPLIVSSASKITYLAERDSTLKNRNVAEAVGRLPFFSIDALQNLSYKNDRSFLVLLNGVRSGLLTQSPGLALKSIPASYIQSIELIFDPPLEYKLKGFDAVVNITTKPGYYQGVLGSVVVSANSAGSYSTETFLSVQKNNSYMQISGAFSEGAADEFYTSAFTDTGKRFAIVQKQVYANRFQKSRVAFSFDQKLSLFSRMGLYSNFVVDNFQREGRAEIRTTLPGADTVATFETNYTNEGPYWEAGADFSRSYGKAFSYFSLLAKYTNEVLTSRSNSGTIGRKRENGRQAPGEFSMQAVNHCEFNNRITFETVLKYVYRNWRFEGDQDSLISDNWHRIANASVREKFRYKVGTISNSISYKSEKFSVRAGLSLDWAAYKAQVAGDTASKTSFNILPIGSIRKKFGKSQFFKIEFYSKLYRPNFRHLASYVSTFDPTVTITGNAKLGNEMLFTLSPEYSFYFGKKRASVYLATDFQFSNSTIMETVSFDSITGQRGVNYTQSKYRNVWAYLGGNFPVSSKLSVYGDLRGGYTTFANNESKAPAVGFNITTTYEFNTTTGAQFLGIYTSKQITNTGVKTGLGSYNLLLYRSFFNGKLQTSFAANNFLLKERTTKEEIRGTVLSGIIQNTRPFRSFEIRVQFQFGKLKTFEMGTGRISNSDVKNLE